MLVSCNALGIYPERSYRSNKPEGNADQMDLSLSKCTLGQSRAAAKSRKPL